MIVLELKKDRDIQIYIQEISKRTQHLVEGVAFPNCELYGLLVFTFYLFEMYIVTLLVLCCLKQRVTLM